MKSLFLISLCCLLFSCAQKQKAVDLVLTEQMGTGFKSYSFEAETIGGRIIRFPEDFKGKYVLLDFWSLDCDSCIDNFRNWYPATYNRYKDAGFEMLAITEDDGEAVRKYMEAHAMEWIVISDKDNDGKIFSTYHIESCPTLFLIDENGYVIDRDSRIVSLREKLRIVYPEIPTFTSYTSEEFNRLLKEDKTIQLVDVRTDKEFHHGSIPGALNIDVREESFREKVDALLDKSRPVAVYCKGGVRSKNAAHVLIDKGYTVYDLNKGYDDWLEARKNK